MSEEELIQMEEEFEEFCRTIMQELEDIDIESKREAMYEVANSSFTIIKGHNHFVKTRRIISRSSDI